MLTCYHDNLLMLLSIVTPAPGYPGMGGDLGGGSILKIDISPAIPRPRPGSAGQHFLVSPRPRPGPPQGNFSNPAIQLTLYSHTDHTC